MCFYSIPFTTKQFSIFWRHVFMTARQIAWGTKWRPQRTLSWSLLKYNVTEHFCDRGGNTKFCGCWEYDCGTSDRPKILILYSKQNKLSGTLFFKGGTLVWVVKFRAWTWAKITRKGEVKISPISAGRFFCRKHQLDPHKCCAFNKTL